LQWDLLSLINNVPYFCYFLWEVRAAQGNNEFRLLGFFDEGNLVILTNGFAKKSQKTPPEQIALAEQRKKDYLGRKNYG
jgi:phage-related protein